MPISQVCAAVYSTLNNYSNEFGLTSEVLYLVSLDISSSRPLLLLILHSERRWKDEEWHPERTMNGRRTSASFLCLSLTVNTSSILLLVSPFFTSASQMQFISSSLKKTFRPTFFGMFTKIKTLVLKKKKTHYANITLSIQQISIGGMKWPWRAQ